MRSHHKNNNNEGGGFRRRDQRCGSSSLLFQSVLWMRRMLGVSWDADTVDGWRSRIQHTLGSSEGVDSWILRSCAAVSCPPPNTSIRFTFLIFEFSARFFSCVGIRCHTKGPWTKNTKVWWRSKPDGSAMVTWITRKIFNYRWARICRYRMKWHSF